MVFLCVCGLDDVTTSVVHGRTGKEPSKSVYGIINSPGVLSILHGTEYMYMHMYRGL